MQEAVMSTQRRTRDSLLAYREGDEKKQEQRRIRDDRREAKDDRRTGRGIPPLRKGPRVCAEGVCLSISHRGTDEAHNRSVVEYRMVCPKYVVKMKKLGLFFGTRETKHRSGFSFHDNVKHKSFEIGFSGEGFSI
jgi:hypothetical protein